MHKTKEPKFEVGCHGNQEAANQVILAHNIILGHFKKALCGFVDNVLLNTCVTE